MSVYLNFMVKNKAELRFKCVYCGQRLLAKENGHGKKGKCPKCKHIIVVPWATKNRPAINADITDKQMKANEAVAAFSISEDLSDNTAELYGEQPGWLIPVYDEMSLFLMSATFILLGVTNSTMRQQLYEGLKKADDSNIYFLAVIFLAGLALSIYHVFTNRDKTDIEKKILLVFAVLANAGTGILAGWYVIKNSEVHNWQLVFPIWNIVNGVLLLLMLRIKLINENCISDRQAAPMQVIFGLAAVFVVFGLCNYIFNLHWAVTFSICIVYTTSFDKGLQSVFPDLISSTEEKTSGKA
jgi:hypothetical protein